MSSDSRPIPAPPMAGLTFDGFEKDGSPKWRTGARPGDPPRGARVAATVAGPPGQLGQQIHSPEPGSMRPPSGFTPEAHGHDTTLNHRAPVFQRGRQGR